MWQTGVTGTPAMAGRYGIFKERGMMALGFEFHGAKGNRGGGG